MNVSMASYAAVSILHGGPNTQVRNTARYLLDYGIKVEFFDPWSKFRRDTCDLFHIFAANIGTYHLAREVHALDVPLMVSPIIYSLHSPSYIRNVLRATRTAQKVGNGIWTDYALAADICTWADRLLPNTNAEGDLLIEGIGAMKEKVCVVPNGVDERFAAADRSLFKKTYGLENFILNVGHIGHQRKNVLSLIRALGQIDHPAVIIGRVIKGQYGDACMREAAKHRHILLIDGLENESEMLASAYAACDVFVLPSLFETPGIAALEAGLAGAKVVITLHGGTKEYFGDMVGYVEPRSVESIKKGIEVGLAKPKDSKLSAHIQREYLWQRVAEKTAEVYKSL